MRTRSNTVICPHCGHRNRSTARVCTECFNSISDAEFSRMDIGDATPRRGASMRRSRRSRADEIRMMAQGGTSSDPRSPTQRRERRGGFDWKIGGLVIGVLGLLGLRNSALGERLGGIFDGDGENFFDNLL